MRTTLKRGVGRGAAVNGNGRAVYPPGVVSAVAWYRQPQPPARSGLRILRRILLATLLAMVSVAAAIGGGSSLYFHQSVAAVRAHSPDVKVAQKQLDVKLPGAAAIALIVGYDHREGPEGDLESRSDTIMLLRADPETKTITLLSFPRDLWMDVDRRYYNKNVGTLETDYADIDLQPGYQRLNATHALEFVRYRHFDSDFFRLARQQEFVRAFKQQVGQNSRTDLVRKLPGLVSAITDNVEVGVGGNNELSGKTVISYAV